MRILLAGVKLIWMLVFVMAFTSVSCAEEYGLGDLYHIAMRNSEKIKYADENLYIARTGKDKAWSLLIPKFTAFGTYNYFSERKYGSPPAYSSVLIQPNESGNWGVRVDENFSLSARELNALKIAGQTVTKNEYDLKTTKTDFVLTVASVYYDTLKAKKNLEVAAANMERLTQYRDSVAKRVQVGELTRTALLRADGELSGARSDYLRATNGFKISRAMLARVVGIDDNFRLKETDALPEHQVAVDRLHNMALDLRNDLKSYAVQTKMAAEQVKYARGAFWPSVGLFAVYNGADQYPSSPTFNRETVLAGVSLTFPFFEGGLRMAELREAKARERQARLAYEDFRKNVRIELERAYLDLQTQKGIFRFLEDQLHFAADNYNAVIRQFDNGLATNLDVMDANSLLLTAEKNVNEARYNYQLAHLNLKRTTGTLLQYIGSIK